MTILDYIKKNALDKPDKTAIIYGEQTYTYSKLYDAMKGKKTLPLPLLGDSWEEEFILKTSGTTGTQKNVIISQEAVIANSENLIEGHEYHKDLIFIIAGDMKHLGCWSKIFPTLMCGATLLILENQMRDIQAFMKAFDIDFCKYGLSKEATFATFLVPANIRILLQFANDGLRMISDRIEFIETGAAPIPQSDMKALCDLLPNTRLYNTYASTETGIIATYNFNDGECIEGCVGKALKHSTFYITQEGNIACKGKTLMTGYMTNKNDMYDLTFDNIITADKGLIDNKGMLHITGREDDIINVGGYKVNPSEVENIASAHPAIKECICIEKRHPIMGSVLALLIVLKENHELNKKDIAKLINRKTDRYKVPNIYEAVETIAKTANGKLNRKYYREAQL